MYCLDTPSKLLPLDNTRPHRIRRVVISDSGDFHEQVVDVSGFSVVDVGKRDWSSQLAGQSNSDAENGEHWDASACNATATAAKVGSEHWNAGACNATAVRARIGIVGAVCKHWDAGACNAAASKRRVRAVKS